MRDEGLAQDAFEWIATGSHRASIRAVAEERADVAAIDAVCWALALRHEPQATAALQIVATTPLRPGLPLITAAERSDREVAAIRAALVRCDRRARHDGGARSPDDQRARRFGRVGLRPDRGTRPAHA